MDDEKKPCCAKCGASAEQLSFERKRLAHKPGHLIYCGGCGAIITWVPEPE